MVTSLACTFCSSLYKSASHPALISHCASYRRSNLPTTMRTFFQAHGPHKSLAWVFTIIPLSQGLSDFHKAAPINAGSFANPGASIRPRFRYWLPDASVDVQTIAADIAAAGSIGAGGIELLPFFEYGGELGSMPAGADWATYNFGTVPFRNIFAAALTAHEQNGLVMDFSLGPNQGQGVPASPDNPGLQWDLVRSALWRRQLHTETYRFPLQPPCQKMELSQPSYQAGGRVSLYPSYRPLSMRTLQSRMRQLAR